MERGKIPFIIACMAVVIGCNSPVTQSGSQTVATQDTLHAQPTTATVEQRDIVGYDVLSGRIYIPPLDDAKLYPPYNAPVEKVFVAVGQHVQKGQQLYQLSFPNVEGNVEAAAAALKQAQADYASARAKYGAPSVAAKAALDQARAAEKQARDAAAVSGDNTALAEATQNRASAESALQQAEADVNNNIIQYRQALDAAAVAYREAKAGAKAALVRAPIEGTVVSLNVQPGQQIGQDAKQQLGEIVDLDDLQIEAGMTPEQAGDVKKGMHAVIDFKEVPGKDYNGSVARIITVPVGQAGSRQTGVQWEAYISFPNTGGLIKPGANIEKIGIKTGEARNALAIPLGALMHDASGKPVVKVLDGQNWKTVVVEPGLSDGQYIQIKSGLDKSQTVQVNGR